MRDLMSRRVVAFAIVGAVLLMSCGPSQSVAPTPPGASQTAAQGTATPFPTVKVRMLVNPGSNSHIPVYVALDAGIFKKWGIDAEIIVNSDSTRPVLTGDADIGFPSPTIAVNALQQGFKVQIFMTLIDRILQAVVVRPDVQVSAAPGKYPDVIQALKGKTLGVTVRGGAVDLNLRYLVKEAGLDPDKDVTITPTGGTQQMLAAMQGSRVDGILALQPIQAVLVGSGKGKILLDLSKGEGPALMKQPFITGFAMQTYIDGHKDAVQRVGAALSETAKYIQDKANSKALSDIILKRVYPDLAPEIVAGIRDQLSTSMNTQCFRASDLTNVVALARAGGVLKPTEEISADQLISVTAQPPGCTTR